MLHLSQNICFRTGRLRLLPMSKFRTILLITHSSQSRIQVVLRSHILPPIDFKISIVADKKMHEDAVHKGEGAGDKLRYRWAL